MNITSIHIYITYYIKTVWHTIDKLPNTFFRSPFPNIEGLRKHRRAHEN